MESIITYKVHSQHNYNESLGNFPQAFCVEIIGAGAYWPLSGRLLGVWGEVVDCFRNKRFSMLKEY